MLKSGAVLLTCLALLGSPGDALAWSNGVNGCNSYGTHDWILDEALRAIGDDASWVKRRVALRATDDPDCKDDIDHASGTWWHVYDRWGEDEWGDAAEAAAVWYRRIGKRLEAGRERAASRALGYFAHIVGDVAQPMHTDGYSSKEDSVHGAYEADVDERIYSYRFKYDGADFAKPRLAIRRLAGGVHHHYRPLIGEYYDHGYNDRVDRITRGHLADAANVLADLIRRMG